MKNFKCYQMAKEQYLNIQKLRLKSYVRDQIDRASLSVCLNLAEGSGKSSIKDRRRFYEMAFASHREVQAILEIIHQPDLTQKADQLGGALFCLIRALST